MRGPGFALSGGHPHPVQRRGDLLVGPATCHALHDRYSFVGRSAAVLAGSRLPDPQLGVLAAAPVDGEDHVSHGLVDIGDDVGDEGAQQPLAGAHRGAGRVPSGLEVLGKADEVRCADRRVRRPHRIQPGLACFDAAQRGLPALLKLCGYEAVVRIASSIAPLSQRGFVAGLLQLKLDETSSFVLLIPVHPLGLQRGLDRHRFHDAEDLLRDGGVDTASPRTQSTAAVPA